MSRWTCLPPPPPPDKPLYLTVKANLTRVLSDTPLAPGTLKAALNRETSGDKTTQVFPRTDKTVKYGDLMAALNDLRAAGYLKVALVGLKGLSKRGLWQLPGFTRKTPCAGGVGLLFALSLHLGAALGVLITHRPPGALIGGHD